jgi:glucosylceramidase
VGCQATTRGAVQAWVTTGDQTRLLHREPVARFGTPAAALPTIEVDTARAFQSMLGFGAAFSDATVWLMRHRMSDAAREALLQDLFGRDGVGFSFARLPMGGSDFSLRHYTYDDVPAGETDPTLARFSIDADRADRLPVLRRALDINPDLFLVASPWSAPAWMKTTGSLVKGTLRPETYDAFAGYFVKFVRAYAAVGVPVRAVTIQNEPHFEPDDYPGMRLEPPARAAIVGRHLGPAFARAGLATQIWEWDHNWDQPQSPLAVLADSAARRFVQGVAWHCYGGDVAAQSTVHDAHPDKDVYFTECAGGAWAPNFADNLKWNVATLVIGATRNWARGVAMWNLALDARGGPHLGGCGNCRGVVTIDSATGAVTRNVEYYALGHASKFVRPGAARVASSTDVQGLATVAFRNPDRSVALIVLNAAPAERTFAVRTGGRAFTYTLSAGAVATFVWR